MADGNQPRVGFRVEAEVLSVKGQCSCNHKAGDTFDVSGHSTAGMCGFLYHDLFPYIVMLQFGGAFPSEWGNTEIVERECMDLANTVKIRLRRLK
jgi:uncharacterized repeat protein (TIGR04076 family)